MADMVPTTTTTFMTMYVTTRPRGNKAVLQDFQKQFSVDAAASITTMNQLDCICSSFFLIVETGVAENCSPLWFWFEQLMAEKDVCEGGEERKREQL